MKQNERPTRPALHVMQTHPIDLDELSLWGIVALRLLGELPVHDGRYGKNDRQSLRLQLSQDTVAKRKRSSTGVRKTVTRGRAICNIL